MNKLFGTIIPILLFVLVIATAIIYWTLGKDLGTHDVSGNDSTQKTEQVMAVGEDNDPCTQKAIETESGQLKHPIASKYSHLSTLGELFTAKNCDQERQEQIYGVDQNTYVSGLMVTLDSGPSDDLLQAFIRLGFQCTEGNFDKACIQWKYDRPIELQTLFELEPFAPEFKSDDCIVCG